MQRSYGHSYGGTYKDDPATGWTASRLTGGQPSVTVVQRSPNTHHRGFMGNQSPKATHHASRTMVVRQVQTGPSGSVAAQERVVMETVTTSQGTQQVVKREMMTSDRNFPEMQSQFQSMSVRDRAQPASFKPQTSSAKIKVNVNEPTYKKDPFYTREFVVEPTTKPAKKVVVEPVKPRTEKREARNSPVRKAHASSDFMSDVVKAHNMYRKRHGKVGDVRLNKEMSVIAQQWAEHLASINSLKHSGDTFKGKPLGENVAAKWGSGDFEYTGADVTEQWYSEIKKYDFRRGQFTSGTGHFTQVVWKGSKEIGVGRATSRNGGVFVVCNYFPAGNMMGQFKDNVLPA